MHNRVFVIAGRVEFFRQLPAHESDRVKVVTVRRVAPPLGIAPTKRARRVEFLRFCAVKTG